MVRSYKYPNVAFPVIQKHPNIYCPLRTSAEQPRACRSCTTVVPSSSRRGHVQHVSRISGRQLLLWELRQRGRDLFDRVCLYLCLRNNP